MIKAIETEYNGYKFRSRLEARWAVFFDYLGISYEYEPEGFQMDDTTCYLPDFYIPEWDAYIEVKGNRPNVANELKKTVKFVNHSLNRVLILSDIPDGSEGLYWFPMIWFNSLTELVNSYWVGLNFNETGAYLITDFETSSKSDPLYDLQRDDFLKKHVNDLLQYKPNSKMNWTFWERDYSLFNVVEGIEPETATQREMMYEIDDSTKLVLCTAYRKARQARFEHGETPII